MEWVRHLADGEVLQAASELGILRFIADLIDLFVLELAVSALCTFES